MVACVLKVSEVANERIVYRPLPVVQLWKLKLPLVSFKTTTDKQAALAPNL